MTLDTPGPIPAPYSMQDVLARAGPVEAPYYDPWRPLSVDLAAARPDYVVSPNLAVTPGRSFASVQAAVDQAIVDAETGGTHRRIIRVEPGRYQGPVYIPAKAPPISLIGAGAALCSLSARLEAEMPGWEYHRRFGADFAASPPMVREIVDHIAARSRLTTGNSSVLRVERNDTVVAGLCIENLYACDRGAAAGQARDQDGRLREGQHQAVALHVKADRVLLSGLDLRSFQDTLYLQTRYPFDIDRVFVEGSRIAGDVDFIFGGATAYFSNCEIQSRGLRGAQSWATAPCTNIHAPYGFVFEDCDFTHDGAEFGADGGGFLGRQWFEGVRSTPYGTPTVPGYQCRAEDLSHYAPPSGSISRRTLEAVGKVAVQNCRIGAHLKASQLWDGWNSQSWNPRCRPVQHGVADFLRYLGPWLQKNGLDYSHLDPGVRWLTVAACQFAKPSTPPRA